MPFTTQYTTSSEKQVSIIAQMLADAGITAKLNIVDYNTVFLASILYSRGDFDGGLTFTGGGAGVDPATTLLRQWHSGGSTPRANLHDAPQQQIDATIDRAMKEFDPEKYKALVQEAQRLLAAHQSAVSYGYSSAPFTPVWPWVMNWNAIRTSSANTGLLNAWFDATKKT